MKDFLEPRLDVLAFYKEDILTESWLEEEDDGSVVLPSDKLK